MKKILFSASTIILAFLIASCSGIPNYTGESLSIKSGEISSVKMETDTYHGFDWIVASNSDPSVAKYEGKENKFGEKNTDMTTQLLKFKGLKKGKTIITLNYVKQGDLLAKKSRTINIIVY